MRTEREELEMYRKENTRLRTMLKNLEGYDRLKNENEMLQGLLDKERKENQRLNAELDGVKNTAERMVAELDHKTHQALHDILIVAAEKDLYKNRLQDSFNRSTVMNQELENLTYQNHQLAQQNRTLYAENEALKKDNTGMKDSWTMAWAKNEELKKEKDYYKYLMNLVDTHCGELYTKLQTVTSERDNLKAHLDNIAKGMQEFFLAY